MFGAALRAVFIIDPAGSVRSVLVNDDGAGRSVAEVRALANHQKSGLVANFS